MCQEACGTCDTASPEQFHPKDVDILKTAREKMTKKTVSKDKKKVNLKEESTTSSPGSPPRSSPGTSSARATTTSGSATTTRSPSAVTSTATAVPVSPLMKVPDTAEPLEESEAGGGGTPQPAVLSAAAIGGFKGGGSRARRATKGARSALKDHRKRTPDTNVWKELLEKRRGYKLRLGSLLEF